MSPGTNRTLGRSAGPRDVTDAVSWTGGPQWILDSAIRSLGPYVVYPDGTVDSRVTGERLWTPGDPGVPPSNPEPGKSAQKHNSGYFGGWT